MEKLPREIEAIIMRYKTDLELLDQIPEPYNEIAIKLPYKSYVSLSTADFLILHVMELVHRVDLREISIDEIIESPHSSLIKFEKASDLQRLRLQLYGMQSSPPLSPLWRLSLPYILLDFLTTSDVFQLRQRLDCYFLSAPMISHI